MMNDTYLIASDQNEYANLLEVHRRAIECQVKTSPNISKMYKYFHYTADLDKQFISWPDCPASLFFFKLSQQIHKLTYTLAHQDIFEPNIESCLSKNRHFVRLKARSFLICANIKESGYPIFPPDHGDVFERTLLLPKRHE